MDRDRVRTSMTCKSATLDLMVGIGLCLGLGLGLGPACAKVERAPGGDPGGGEGGASGSGLGGHAAGVDAGGRRSDGPIAVPDAGEPAVCGYYKAPLAKVPPDVLIVLDRSGSMDAQV